MGLSIISVDYHTGTRVPLRIDHLDSVFHILPILCDVQSHAPRRPTSNVLRFVKVQLPRRAYQRITLCKRKLRRRGHGQSQQCHAAQNECCTSHDLPPHLVPLPIVCHCCGPPATASWHACIVRDLQARRNSPTAASRFFKAHKHSAFSGAEQRTLFETCWRRRVSAAIRFPNGLWPR